MSESESITEAGQSFAESLGGADQVEFFDGTKLQIFYDSDVCQMLHDPDLGLHLMSDTYIVNDLIEELRRKQ